MEIIGLDLKGLASFQLDCKKVNWRRFDLIMLKRIKWEGVFGISKIGFGFIAYD